MKTSRLSTFIFYASIAVFLGLFLLYPLTGVFTRTFFFNGDFTFTVFWGTISGPIVINALVSSLLLGTAAVLFSACIALPLAIFVSGYEFPLKKLIGGLVLVPMILPPFVGAIGIQRLFARYGLLNSLFGLQPFDWLGQGGFWGVAFLQALHLFPIMYLNVTAALSNIDPQLEEAAQSAGAPRWKVFRDVTGPLMLPGLFSGAIIVFLWSFTDLGTPLVLGFRQVLAVEIFDRAVSINNDPTGPAMVVFVILITVLIMLAFKRFFTDDTLTSSTKGYRGRELKKPSPKMGMLIYVFSAGVLCLSLLPHAGLLLTSIARDWFMTPFPSSATLEFYRSAASTEGVIISVQNSLLYSSLSTIIDIIFGVFIAYFLIRNKIKAGWIVDALVMLPIVLPGIILAFGYVATFSGTFLDPLKNPVPLLVIGYAVRRLPYTFRAAYAGLQQVSPEFEEASRVSGATPLKAVSTVTIPLIAANIVAGGILCFMFAMLEVSESMILAVKEQFFPITRQIYALISKIPDGDYVASALGVLCMLFLSAGICAASMLMGKHLGRMFRM
jgi:iron(III) transport system permease protein